jgi:hypothetical protein
LRQAFEQLPVEDRQKYPEQMILLMEEQLAACESSGHKWDPQ